MSPYDMGSAAFDAGDGSSQNPFSDREERHEWLTGFLEAYREWYAEQYRLRFNG